MNVRERPVRQAVRKMGVVVTHHVVGKSNHSMSGEVNATCGDAALFLVRHATVAPMPMRIKYRGERAFALAEGTVEVASEIKAGAGFNGHFLNAVTLTFQPAEHTGMERRFVGHRPQPATHQHLLPDFARSRLPFLAIGNGGELPWSIQVPLRKRRLAGGWEATPRRQKSH